MRIVDRGTVVAARADTDRRSCCFPGVCVLPSGRWLVGFRAGPAKSSRTERALMTWSDDQGKTWSEPVERFPPLKLGAAPGTWRTLYFTALGGPRVLATLCWVDCSDPFVPMFNEKTEGIVNMRLFTAVSEDEGAIFGPVRPVTTGRYDAVPTPCTGASLVLPGGGWAAQFEVNKHYDDPTPWQHASSLVFSTDQGQTWSEAVDAHTDPEKRVFCWDQRVAALPDGGVLVPFWTFDRVSAKYVNMHARRSTDGGRTWGELWDTGLPGQPARPVGLPDGRIVLVYVDRTAEPTIKARLSADGGRSWPDATELVVQAPTLKSQTWDKKSMQDAWAEMSKFSLGLPDAVVLPTGEVLAVYYHGPFMDQTDIQWARIAV